MDPLFKPDVLKASHLKGHNSSKTLLFCRHVLESTVILSTKYTKPLIFSLFIPAVLTKYVQVWNSHKTQL